MERRAGGATQPAALTPRAARTPPAGRIPRAGRTRRAERTRKAARIPREARQAHRKAARIPKAARPAHRKGGPIRPGVRAALRHLHSRVSRRPDLQQRNVRLLERLSRVRRSVRRLGFVELRRVRPRLHEHADLLERDVHDGQLRRGLHQLQRLLLRSHRTQEQLRHVRSRLPRRSGLLREHVPLPHRNGIVQRRSLSGRLQRRSQLRRVRHALRDRRHVHERRLRLPEQRHGVLGHLLRHRERRSPLRQLHDDVQRQQSVPVRWLRGPGERQLRRLDHRAERARETPPSRSESTGSTTIGGAFRAATTVPRRARRARTSRVSRSAASRAISSAGPPIGTGRAPAA